MAIQFTTTRDAARLRGVKVLVHGRAGAGKTRLCATAPAPIIISAEAGLLSLQDENIPVINITSIADLDEAYQFCAYSIHAKQFLTICLDSISEIAEVCLTEEKQKHKDPRKSYGEMQDKIIARMRWFRDLQDKHVYFSAKQAAVKDELTGVTLYGPSAPGQKVGPALPYLFDEIFSLEVAKDPTTQRTYNYLRCQRDLQYEVKDRSGRLDPYEQPNLTTIFEKILGKAA